MVSTGVGFKCPRCTGTVAVAADRRRTWLLAVIAVTAGAVAIAIWGLPSPTGGGSGRQEAAGTAGGAAGGLAAEGAVRRVQVRFRGAGGAPLAGTLDAPGRGARGRAAALVIPGFGPTNRDGVLAGPDLTDALYRDLGDVLAREGRVVLRYDKRSASGRAGPDRPPIRFDHYVGDAVAALAFLRRRPEVDAANVALIGHDEGGLVGMRVAAREPRVRSLVLVSTPGRPLARVVAQEIRGVAFGGSDRRRAALAREFAGAVRTLLETGRVPAVSSALRPVLPQSEPAYLRSLFSLDPTAEAGAVRAPVLIVRGSRDPGIRREDVRALRRSLRASRGATVLQVRGAGHTLRTFAPSAAGHGHAGSRSPRRDFDALRQIGGWIRAQATPEAGR